MGTRNFPSDNSSAGDSSGELVPYEGALDVHNLQSWMPDIDRVLHDDKYFRSLSQDKLDAKFHTADSLLSGPEEQLTPLARVLLEEVRRRILSIVKA